MNDTLRTMIALLGLFAQVTASAQTKNFEDAVASAEQRFAARSATFDKPFFEENKKLMAWMDSLVPADVGQRALVGKTDENSDCFVLLRNKKEARGSFTIQTSSIFVAEGVFAGSVDVDQFIAVLVGRRVHVKSVLQLYNGQHFVNVHAHKHFENIKVTTTKVDLATYHLRQLDGEMIPVLNDVEVTLDTKGMPTEVRSFNHTDQEHVICKKLQKFSAHWE